MEDEVEVKRDGVAENENQAGGDESKEISSEVEEGYVTTASHCKDKDVVDEEAQEPSMEMESAPPRPVVPMPAAPTASSSTPASAPQSQINPENPALLLQPEDLCLAVWAEDGVCIYCT